jgi:hypothetical protein
VQHAGARPQAEGVDRSRDDSRRPVEQLARGIDRNRHVVIEVARVGIRRLPGAGHDVAFTDDEPRARLEKRLARNGCERLDQRGRREIADCLDVLGEEPAAQREIECYDRVPP